LQSTPSFGAFGAGHEQQELVSLKNILSAEASFGAPTAHCNAAFLNQAGVPVAFVRLADTGMRGNGHFLML
jgi:hypothetical protein